MIRDILLSFRRLPLWVQLWMALWLFPVNMAPLMFLGEPGAIWLSVLSVGGMLPNLWILIRERGFSTALALPHVVAWMPLVGVICTLLARDDVSGPYRTALWVVLITDLVSLGFDLPDSWRWWRGARAVA
jgi:hypothetical protein